MSTVVPGTGPVKVSCVGPGPVTVVACEAAAITIWLGSAPTPNTSEYGGLSSTGRHGRAGSDAGGRRVADPVETICATS